MAVYHGIPPRQKMIQKQMIQQQIDDRSVNDMNDMSDMEERRDMVSGHYRIITGGYGNNPLGGGLFRKIDESLVDGFKPIGGLTIDAKGKSYQVMYRDRGDEDDEEESLIDLTDPPTIPIQETLAGVFNSNSGGKRNKKKSKKYISKCKNKTKKRN
jgi:hypothetical protein